MKMCWLKMIRGERALTHKLKKRQMKWIGQTIGQTRLTSLLRTAIEGKMGGKKIRGRTGCWIERGQMDMEEAERRGQTSKVVMLYINRTCPGHQSWGVGGHDPQILGWGLVGEVAWGGREILYLIMYRKYVGKW